MARAWNEQDVENVKGVLASGSGRDEVCAITGCDAADLDSLCMKAFGMPYVAVEARYHAIGVAMVRKAMFEAACSGNAKAAEMFKADVGKGATGAKEKPSKSADVLKLVQADRAQNRKAAGS